MNCTIVYGLGSNIKHKKEMTVADAFKYVRTGGWIFYDIYYQGRLVFTTQGAAGSRYICKGCPYAGRR